MKDIERSVEVAAGEFIHIPQAAREVFRRPAFAYTPFCQDPELRHQPGEFGKVEEEKVHE